MDLLPSAQLLNRLSIIRRYPVNQSVDISTPVMQMQNLEDERFIFVLKVKFFDGRL